MSRSKKDGVCLDCCTPISRSSHRCHKCSNRNTKLVYITHDEFEKIDHVTLIKARHLFVSITQCCVFEMCTDKIRIISSRSRFYFPCISCNSEYETSSGREKTKKHKWHCQGCAVSNEWKEDKYHDSHVEAIKLTKSSLESKAKHSRAQRLKYEDPVFRQKTTDALRKVWQTEEYKQKKSASLRHRWATNPPKCISKRFKMVHHGNEITLKSSYEILFAKYLSDKQYSWSYEPKTYVLESLGNRVLIPDFYIEELDVVVEIKGYFWKDAKEKWEAFMNEYPHVRKIILFKQELQSVITGEKKLEDYL